MSLDHARIAIAAWARDYNQERPHSSLGYETPALSAECGTGWRLSELGSTDGQKVTSWTRGTSAVLRRLVDAAVKTLQTADHTRRATEAAYRFMSALAGDLPAFEEASRALFAADQAAFEVRTSSWPPDVREELGRLLDPVFANGGAGA